MQLRRTPTNLGSASVSLVATTIQIAHTKNGCFTPLSFFLPSTMTDAPSTSRDALEDDVMDIGSSMERKREESDDDDDCGISMKSTSNSNDHMPSTESFVGTAGRNVDLTRSRESLASSTLEATPAKKQIVRGDQTSYTTSGSIFSESGYKEYLDCEAPYTDDRARVYFRRRAGKVSSLEHRTSLSCPQMPSKENFKRKKGECRGIPKFCCSISTQEVGKPKRRNVNKKNSLPQNFVKEQQAYFAEVDAFELQEEEVAEKV